MGSTMEGALRAPMRNDGRLRAMRDFLFALALMFVGFAAPIASAAETVDEPDAYRTNDYRSPVPATLKGGKVIAYAEAKALFDAKSAVFIDVYPRAPKPPNLPAGTIWRDPPHESIPGSAWLANVGYGVLPPPMQAYFTERLASLTSGDKSKPVVFFCLKNCWQSWNAAKRALEMGYTNVMWFPDGVDAWRDESQFVDNIEPLP